MLKKRYKQKWIAKVVKEYNDENKYKYSSIFLIFCFIRM